MYKYYRRTNARDGLSYWCKDCHNDAKRRSRLSNPQRERDSNHTWRKNNENKYKLSLRRVNLKGKYGLTIEDYVRLLEKQGGKCALCGRSGTGRRTTKNYNVDHNHLTGKIRGLLCHQCNLGLGILGLDSVPRVKKLIKYLHKGRKL